MDSVNCPLCGDNNIKMDGIGPLNTVMAIQCKRCGLFLMEDRLRKTFPEDNYSDKKHLLSGWTREKHERRLYVKADSIPKISYENIDAILRSPLIPRIISDKANKILLYIFMRTKRYGVKIQLNWERDYSIAYAYDQDEFGLLLKQLEQDKKIENFPNQNYSLTFKGYQYAEELNAGNIQSNTFFVAMWFDKQMEKAFEYIQQVKEVLGFVADRVDKSNDYNGDINDQIIAKIRRSRFVLADFTGDRGGVYYEAGYAKALGREVIFTCRKDWFKNLIWRNGRIKNNGEERDGEFLLQTGPHFDAEHENFIVWEDEEELKKKLIDRINATIL